MLTFLDLVNALITELGVNGGQLLTSTGGGTLAPGGNTPGQGSSTYSPEVARIVSFVADADYEIQSLHHDWNFLWRQYRNTLTVGQDWLATPRSYNGGTPNPGYTDTSFTLRRVNQESLTINYSSITQSFRPVWMPWRDFERTWQSRGAKNSSDYPTNWTVAPNGIPLLSHASATGLGYQYDGWIRPRRMNYDGDVSPLIELLVTVSGNQLPHTQATTPTTAGPLSPAGSISNPVGSNSTPTSQVRYESCRIIIARAKVIWAEVEGATEIMQGALAEYQDLLEELRADQLPGMRTDRMSESDTPLEVVTI